MPKGGTLRLETKNVGSADDVPAGEFVALVVTDTGTGIAPENIEKVFEPFFTTKQAGHGSGLGLSMVDGFVRQSGGTVRLRSAPGAGTELTLYFPRATSAAEPVQPVDLGSIEPGQGTILLVDDDKDVGQITAEALEQLGYAVILAHDAAEALRVVADRGTEIDVLVTDLVMPGAMNGIDLAHAVAAQCPDLATIFITGHSDALNTITSDGASAVLLKPFRQASLAAAVRDALARKQRAAPPGAAVPVADAPAGD
jgi:CheY-like chemotaxis protein